MHVEVSIIINMVELDQVTGHKCKGCDKQTTLRDLGDEKQGTLQYIKDEEATMDALIARMVFDPAVDTYKPGNNNSCKEVDATVIPFSPCPNLRQARDIPTAHSPTGSESSW